MKDEFPGKSGQREFSDQDIQDLNERSEEDFLDEVVGDEEEYEESGGRKKVLVTGSHGQLGKKLMNIFPPDYEVAGVDIDEMDVTNPDDVLACFYLHRPDIVIHAAAMTDVDGCEVNPEQAYRVNSLGTQNIAAAVREFGATILYVSTDYVFDGEKEGPYYEFDKTNPINVYGRSKLFGEIAIRELVRKFFIVRTSWLIGGGKNFIRTILKAASEKGELKVVDDQTGRPTFTHDLSYAIKSLVNTPFYGVYHITNAGETTWFGFASKAVELAGIDAKITPCTSDEFPTKARRPKNSSLSNTRFDIRDMIVMPDWEEALEEYIKNENLRSK